MIDNLRYLISTFSARDRRRLVWYVLGQFLASIMDVLGIAAILPLMQMIVGRAPTTGTLGDVYGWFGSPPVHTFVLLLAAVMIGAFVLKAAIATWLNWWSAGLVTRLQTSTARKLLDSYMRESFLTHRSRSTGELIRTVGSATTDAHAKVLSGMMTLISSAMSIAFIVVFLLIVLPIPTLVAGAYFAIAVFAIQRVLAPANRRAGEEAQYASWISGHALVDAMQGFREARLHDAEDFFVDRYDTANTQFADSAKRANFLSALPKNLLELLTMIGIVLLLVVSLLIGNPESAVPALSLFVAATIKLLPMMVSLTATIGMIRVGEEGLAITVAALRAPSRQLPAAGDPAIDGNGHDGSIRIDAVTFRYPDAHVDVVSDISLTVPPGSSIALCGPSGSGKTTLVDIVLGLIEPTHGTVTYKGLNTADGGPGWHDDVAYVPQDVYITDDSLAGNVAFGIAPELRDDAHVVDCLRRAELGALVATLPKGIDTLVGERGNRLSGGQRQRIGIARALYRRPRVIVLDEATSALDNHTEHEITRTLHSLRGDITMIIVAHRLSTVRDVDNLVFLSDGRVQAEGTFSQVVRASDEFAHLVALGRLDIEQTDAAS